MEMMEASNEKAAAARRVERRSVCMADVENAGRELSMAGPARCSASARFITDANKIFPALKDGKVILDQGAEKRF